MKNRLLGAERIILNSGTGMLLVAHSGIVRNSSHNRMDTVSLIEFFTFFVYEGGRG